MANLYDGKVVIVTNAGNVVGRACVNAFAAEGAAVVASDRCSKIGGQIVEAVRQAGGRAEFIQCDVSDSAQVNEMITFAAQRYGRFDILVNNASVESVPDGFSIQDCPDDSIWKIMHTQYGGCFYGTRAAINQFLAQGTSGWVINIGSLLGELAYAPLAHYIASRQAIDGLTESAAETYGPSGIRVNAILGRGTPEAIAANAIVLASEHVNPVRLHWTRCV